MELIKQIQEKIQSADMVLVGIGEELSVDFEKVLSQNMIYTRFQSEIDMMKSADCDFVKNCIYFHELNERNPLVDEKISLYNKLLEQLNGKNYYVVSVCNDDVILKSQIPSERVVRPCGTRTLMQCGDVCTDEVKETEEYFVHLYSELERMYDEEHFDSECTRNNIPKCKQCEKSYEMNLVSNSNYSEQGYSKDWERYTKWLQGTINKNILIMEFGVSFAYPTVIRWPFEKITTINNKAAFVRINETFPQIPKEIAEKSIWIEDNSKNVIAMFE